MDFLDVSPQQEQQLMAQALRSKQLLGENNEKANQYSKFAAIAQLANNPEVARAAIAAHKNAQDQYKPTQMGLQGFALPSGEFAESPMYTQDKMLARNQQAGLQAERVAAQQQSLQDRLAAQAEAQQAQRAHQMQMQQDRLQAQAFQAEQNRALRGTMAAMAESRQAGKAADKPLFKETDIQKLGAFVDKKQLPRLMSQGRQLAQQLDQFGEDTPGFGADEKALQSIPFGSRMLKPEAVDNLSAINGIYNAFTRADAGLSQTLNETQRQALEMFNSPTTNAKVRAQVFRKHILPLIDQARGATLGTAHPSALAEYRARQEAVGGDVGWMDPLTVPQAPAKPTGVQGKPQVIPAGLQLPPGFKVIGPAP